MTGRGGTNGIAAATDTATVTATAPPSADATLSGLTVNDGTSDLILDPPTFAAGTFDYAVSVANAVTSITIAPTLSDSNATVEYLNENDAVIPDTNPGTPALDAALAEGDNVINVTVTAQDTTTTQSLHGDGDAGVAAGPAVKLGAGQQTGTRMKAG